MAVHGKRRPSRLLQHTGRYTLRTMALAAFFVVTLPALAFAAAGFIDVTEGDPHLGGITYVSQNGIALGFENGQYRPLAPVNRGQMATFFYRASGNDPQTPPSVNADRLDGLDAADLVAAGAEVRLDEEGQPYVDDWFNYINGVEPTVMMTEPGVFVVDIGFGTADAQFQVTVERTDPDTRDAFATAGEGGQDEVYVDIYDVSVGGPAAAAFYLLVYGE